ncbi:CSPG4 protein, partial [Pomatorhinus ruficollis]|nr:CSPG4 protein [Pomatorhinus ruficollis]
LLEGGEDSLELRILCLSMQARLQLGLEEVTLQSPAGLQINNLAVHDVELLVEDGRMTLTIDGLFNSSADIAGPARELDIQYGLYAGGTGSLDLPYLAGASPPFRGCLHLVTFNGLDVLSRLSADGSSKTFYRVQEGCSTQFSADPEDPFGFPGPHSYIAFPTWDARQEATIEFVITTSITQAPLIYHAGLENDFFYLEISNGRLRGFVEKGNGVIVLHNNVFISDEQQHYVKVHTDKHKFEILIDYYASSTSNRGINNYLDLQGNLFIGGMDEKALQRLREHHLSFVSLWTMTNHSFVGCLEDLRINLQRRSLQDAVITKDITAGCGKQDHYWDYEEVYEQDEASTSPPPNGFSGAPGLVVEPCRPDSSFPPAFANVSRLLHVSPLIVSEGGMAYLEWKHAQPTVDLSLANIRQSQILFSITNDPRHGQLELDIPGSRSRRKFTLLDIVNRKVRYIHDGSEGPMDQLMLEVTVTTQQGVPECLRQGQMYLLPIMINPVNDAPQVIFPRGNLMTILRHTRKHLTTDILQVLDDDSISIGGDPDAPTLTNVLLTVQEGGQAVISKDHLFVQSVNSMDYVYEVIEGPAHGRLAWAASHGWASREEITEFSNDDILQRRLLYQHDDSETLEDDIPFVAIRQGEGSAESEAEEVRGVFRVSIQPVNDHSPVRAVNRVFNVVRNGQHLLTTDDIAFTDKDSGFSDAQLVLTRKDILFGSIVSVDDRSHQVYRFTQDDLRKKKVLFVHSGADRGWIQLQVSDGLHQTTALLEVQASEPYIKIVNNTGLVIHQGTQGSIDSSVLSLETNMDIRSDEEIRFLITNPPRWGTVLRGEQPVMAFSQRDLLAGEISYHHNGSRNSRDELQFTVEANEVAVEDTLAISVFLDTHPSPLSIVNHREIYVFQGEAAGIKEEDLLVTHEEISSQDIVYLVSSPPSSGFLAMLQHSQDMNEQPSLDPIQSFTQEDINSGRVLYRHSKPNEERDRFVLDITARSADPLEGVVVSLVVLPITVPLDIHNITVPAGGSATISSSILRIPNAYYPALGMEFSVLEPPRVLGAWTLEKMPRGRRLPCLAPETAILRDNSKVWEVPPAPALCLPQFSPSSPGSFPPNPFCRPVSTGPKLKEKFTPNLLLREGTTAVLSPHILRAEDEDSPAEEVTYSIQPPANGKVVLRAAPGTEVQRFTQAQIDNGLVLFVHQGPLDGGFAFDLWDGENLSPGHFFLIRAQREPVISLARKQSLTVCPGALQPITSQNLQAMSNSPTSSTTLYYSIEQAPRLGRLTTSQGEEIRNFTQAQVDSNLIFYQHEMPDKPFWLAQDAIRFRVVTPTTISDSFILLVLISFEENCPQRLTQLWKNAGLQLTSAQQAEIDTSVLDASNLLSQILVPERAGYDVVFLVTQPPARGQLLVAGVPLEQSRPFFLQSDLVARRVVYAHSGDSISKDHFSFKAWLQPREQQSVRPPQDGVVISEAFNITVTSSTKSPQVVKRKEVLQVPPGSVVTLSQEYLDVADALVSPQEMVYSVL